MKRGYRHYNMEVINERKRRRIIIDFIINNQYCIVEDIVRGVKENIGRKKVFKIMKDLKREHIVLTKRAKPTSRSIPLFVNTNNPLVIVPRELDKFENEFTLFLDNLVNQNRISIIALNTEIGMKINEYKKYFKTRRNAKLTRDEFDYCMEDVELHTSMEELSIRLSTFVKAMEILNELSRVYSIRSMVDWPRRIKDKESLNELLSVVSDKLDYLRIQLREKISPIFGSFFDIHNNDIETISNSSIDLEEITEYYSYFGLEKEVEPVLVHIRQVRGDLQVPNKNPWHRLGIVGPLEVGVDDVKELFDPNSYYREHMKSRYDDML